MTSPNDNFAGLHVGAFESRRAAEMARLIERHGGVAHVSPSMREVACDERSIIDFANHLITGNVDVVIFLTGVGFDKLLAVIERHVPRQRYLDALSDIVTIARGPKAAAAMRRCHVSPKHLVPEPNTWREVLQLIDTSSPVANLQVVVQEYGQPNTGLVAGLEARGAHVVGVEAYRWELVEELGPMEQNVRDLAEGRLDVVLITTAFQVTAVQQVADRLGLREAVDKYMASTVVGSVGPMASAAIREAGWPVDVQPEHPKMGPLVAAAARQSHSILQRKRGVRTTMSNANAPSPENRAPWYDSPFMKACRHEPTDVTPIWLMRQAGRYMAEYREVRAKTTFLELCKDPALCSEVMCTAVNRLGVDAAIIFSDLLPILEPMGLDLEFAKGEGPVIHNPVRSSEDVDRVLELETVEPLDFVMETVRQTRNDIPSTIPLIGFSGAPFTLASYVLEGGGSRSYVHTKTLMYQDEGAWRTLMERLARAITLYLNGQIAAGAQCVQLFDSWAGALGPDEYRQFVLPYVKQIIGGITPGTPVINFATGNPQLLPLLAEAGGAVIGVDWRIRLDAAWEVIGDSFGTQGNLDPGVLLSDPAVIRAKAKEVLDQAGGRPGHIFNLGHGVLQQTPVDNAIALVDAVHEMSRR